LSVDGTKSGAGTMVPKILLRSATAEDRLFVRKWTYGVAVVYGALALAVIIIAVGTMGRKNTLEASRVPDNHASSALDR
jgi:hypothetical protein